MTDPARLPSTMWGMAIRNWLEKSVAGASALPPSASSSCVSWFSSFMATPWSPSRAAAPRTARTCARSDFHQFEVFLAGTAFGTHPVRRDIFPAGAGGDAFVGQACLFIVYPATDQTHP